MSQVPCTVPIWRGGTKTGMHCMYAPMWPLAGFNPSKTESELKVGTGGFPIKSKCQMTRHHHVADSGIECTIGKFVDDTKLRCAVDTPEGQDAIHRDLDKLKKWAHVNLMRLKKAKCKVLHLGRGNSQYPQYSLGDEGIENSPAKRTWGYWWMKSWT
ncbi:rna-directed dna polymerase from mobile element jockey-like [Limosa lapponica baueri]|uniref:Rna-directed dna polymerase from mobile element jockey-like n=1 Tax=Limosa lapponica baueri TaxID=1758121 RepID=A0A2I0UI46_LIMLA|nr:rna-directed dna polymerase from mobile element jockey-like [Limosa lapponica baueri]